MRSPVLSVILLFYVAAGVAVAAAPTPNATADEEYWAKRAQIAGSYNRGAFVSDPIETMNRFNNDVEK
jgi:pectate lyase